MLVFDEAAIAQWLNPLLWPFLRTLAMLTALPVFSQRAVPIRVRVGLAFFIAISAQASLPVLPVLLLDSPAAIAAVIQQVVIGIAIGFSVRVVFSALEFAGELVGLQMGLNFAGFFDPSTGGQATATSRFFGTMAAFLFIITNGHLLLIQAVVQSFHSFPVGSGLSDFLHAAAAPKWGAEVFRVGLWVALPLITMLLFVNLVLGVISRVAPQINIFAMGFPVTLGVGLLGLVLTLPLMQTPFALALERMLTMFGPQG